MEWYWCLTHSRVESAEDRDDIENALGPYPSEDAARNWKETVDARNEAWEAEDERWRGEGGEPGDDAEAAD